MYPKEIQDYISQLFRRRHEAVVVERAVMDGGGWQPLPNRCHDNVNEHFRCDNRYVPVRGWLLFDYGYFLGYVSFLQHSVLRFPDGSLVDITPSNASQDYPFLMSDETDDEFFSKEKFTKNGNLYYFLKT